MRYTQRLKVLAPLVFIATLLGSYGVSGAGSSGGSSGGGSGDVVGPASATDNAIARYDLITGKLLQNSAVTIADTTGAISGAQSITGGSSGSSTLTLDGDSNVAGSATVDGAGNLSANKATVATGSTGGVVVGTTLLRENAGALAVTDAAVSVWRGVSALSYSATGDVNAGGLVGAPIVALTPGSVGSCGAGQKGYLRAAADGTLCSCNGTVWTATPASGSCT